MDALDRLASQQLSDEKIIGRDPFRVTIGQKTLVVRCLPIRPWGVFQRLFGAYLATFFQMIAELNWPEWEDKDDEEKMGRLARVSQRMVSSKKSRRFIYVVLRRTLFRDLVNRRIGWWQFGERRRAEKSGWEPPMKQRMSFRYFLKHVTPDQLMRIWYAMYLYNISAVKKNALSMARVLRLDLVRSGSSTPRPSGGLVNGSYQPRFPDSPFLRRDTESGKIVEISRYVTRRDARNKKPSEVGADG